VISIGSPVLDAAGKVVAAISGAFARGTSPDLTIAAIARVIGAAAAEVSTALGHIAPARPGRKAVA
jgi:DNA-binding IclR family transcriptional regulator